MFVDEIEIEVKGGNGGDGAVSFRREKFEPRGGPDGGDGGDGGDVILAVDRGLNALSHLRYEKDFKAEDGESGGERGKNGREGSDITIKVPPGTMVFDEKGRKVADLTEENERFLAAAGGSGGRGNTRFANSSRQTPRFSEQGEPGEKRKLKLELKLIADVGIVGFPNVGKSTLISTISAARPRIDDYHFTTVSPNLGVVEYDEYHSYVAADVPGLIEDAHSGEGLGDTFLKHLERTKLLVHVLDAAALEGRDPLEDFIVINRELEKYSSELAELPQIVALNKIDLPRGRNRVADLMKHFQEKNFDVYPISAATGEGVDVLKKEVGEKVKNLQEEPSPVEKKEKQRGEKEEVVITPETQKSWRQRKRAVKKEIRVEKCAPDRYRVKGSFVEDLLERTDLNNEEALQRMLSILREEGLHEKLEKAGIRDGMTVVMGNMEFDYVK